jgi:hypothetical protein
MEGRESQFSDLLGEHSQRCQRIGVGVVLITANGGVQVGVVLLDQLDRDPGGNGEARRPGSSGLLASWVSGAA